MRTPCVGTPTVTVGSTAVAVPCAARPCNAGVNVALVAICNAAGVAPLYDMLRWRARAPKVAALRIAALCPPYIEYERVRTGLPCALLSVDGAVDVGTAKSSDAFGLEFVSGKADCERWRAPRVSMISTSSSRALSIMRTFESTRKYTSSKSLSRKHGADF